MESILKYEETRPLSYALMKKTAPSWCQVRLYDSLNKYSSLKQAASGKPCMIVLYDLHDTTQREKVGVGHYSLILLQPKLQYWSSYGYPVDYEISLTHSKKNLKDLLGTHFNAKVPYQAKEHTATCWKWCILRASVYKMPETRFKQLFYNTSPRLRTPDDLVSTITLGLLGAEYMGGALTRQDKTGQAVQETESGGALRRTKRSTKGKQKKKKGRRTYIPFKKLKGRNPLSRFAIGPQYDDVKFIQQIPVASRLPREKDYLQNVLRARLRLYNY